jgi:hypothetical protein
VAVCLRQCYAARAHSFYFYRIAHSIHRRRAFVVRRIRLLNGLNLIDLMAFSSPVMSELI